MAMGELCLSYVCYSYARAHSASQPHPRTHQRNIGLSPQGRTPSLPNAHSTRWRHQKRSGHAMSAERLLADDMRRNLQRIHDCRAYNYTSIMYIMILDLPGI